MKKINVLIVAFLCLSIGALRAQHASLFNLNSRVASPCSLSVSISSSSPALCYGGNTGSATALVSGGVQPYTYSWSNGSTVVSTANPTGNVLSAGTYTVTVTDSTGGCSNTASVTISQPIQLTVTATYTNSVCYGGLGCVSASASGGIPISGLYDYSWVNSSSSVVSNSSTDCNTLTAGSYTVIATDANGCTATASVSFTQPNPMAVSTTVLANACSNLSNGQAIANATGGTLPYSYSWTNLSSTVVSTSNPTGAILSAGRYTVAVTDSCGEIYTTTVLIKESNTIRDSISVVTSVGCNGGSGGTATVGVSSGTSPFTYLWSPSGQTKSRATGLSAGSYTVIVTDNNGCSGTNTVVATITQPAVLNDSLVSITYPACNGGRGDITIGVTGGNLPYSYFWTYGVSTTATATNIASRTYTITIHDKYNCAIAPLVVNLTQPAAIRDTIVAAAKINVSCNGGNNGSATVGVKYGTSPYTYAWSPNVSSSATATGLTAGVYSITVTDNNGCSSSVAKVTIFQPGDLRDSISGHSCSNSLVRATVGVKGGTSPYTYAWSPGGGTKATMSNLAPGTYSITVTDNNGCSNTLIPSLSCPVISHDGQDNGSEQQCCAGRDNINLYPNPNTGQFTLAGLEPGMTVEMYDYTGRKINSQLTVANAQLIINVSDQPNGIYLIRILDKAGNLVAQKKVVKTN